MKSSDSLSFHFQGDISVPDGREYFSGYIQLPFEVPDGVSELCLKLRYAPASVGGVTNLVTLGLFDPHGFRGNAHRSPPDEQICLAADRATVGFLAGPLTAGTWLAQLAVHSVLADTQPCRYTLDIELRTGPDVAAASTNWQPGLRVLRDQWGWYKGELHSHTFHSDGDWTGGEMIAAAQKRGLDFLFITDHNTHSVYPELAGVEPDGLLLIPGIELTTFEGHALVLGIQNWIDWRCGYAGWRMEDAAREIQEQQGLFIITHPHALGSPFCTGCRWDYADFDLARADGLEVWNGMWESEGDKNPQGLRMWHELQKNGLNITATAGTDIHNPHDWDAGMGAPVVYVNARSLSAEGVLEGIRAGRVILSSGPWIYLRAHSEGTDGAIRGVGETCKSASRTFKLTAEWVSVPDNAQLVIRNSQDVVEVVEVSGAGTISREVIVEEEDRFWLELYRADGALLALTNPVRLQFARSGKSVE